MRIHSLTAGGRIWLIGGAYVCLAGCINLPPALERELACPTTQAPDNFGSAKACTPADAL